MLVSALAATFIFTMGFSNVFAEELDLVVPYAIPVDAAISNPNVNEKGTQLPLTRTLSWGGGVGAIYNVSYDDGLTTRQITANYYSTSHTQTYQLGSYSTYTWDNILRVSNGTNSTAYAYVKLTR